MIDWSKYNMGRIKQAIKLSKSNNNKDHGEAPAKLIKLITEEHRYISRSS